MNRITFQVSEYSANEDRLLAVRNRNRPVQESRDYADWRYVGEGGPHRPLLFWATCNGKDIGLAGLVPRRYSVDGGDQWLWALGDISLNQEFRGQGVAADFFRFLNQYAADQELGTLLVLPNRRAAPALAKAGWQQSGELHRHVLLLDPSEKLTRILRPRSLARATGRLFRTGLRWSVSRRRSRGVHVADESLFASTAEHVWRHLPKSQRVIRDRSLETLDWRYRRQPGRQYRHLPFFEGSDPAGFAVVQHVAKENAVHVLDFIVLNQELLSECLATMILGILSSGRATTIRFLANLPDPISPVLKRFGFLDRDPTTPVQLRQPATSLLTNAQAWLIRDGDKDA